MIREGLNPGPMPLKSTVSTVWRGLLVLSADIGPKCRNVPQI